MSTPPTGFSSSDMAALADAKAAQRKVRFDPTINLGHLISIVGFMVAGFGAYNQLDKRIALQEAETDAVERTVSNQTQETRDALREIRADVKEVGKDVNAISVTLGARAPRASGR